MDAKIKELTEKIYHEGVERGNQEAAQILAEAKKTSEEIVLKAQKEADRIVAEATKAAADLRENTASELRLYADQVISSTKSAIADSITDQIVRSNVSAMTTDPAFMQRLMLSIIERWNAGEPMVIETADARALGDYMTANAKHLLDSGRVTIREVNGKGTGFSILPKDGGYRIDFGDEEFVSFFKSFLRPQLVEMLF